MPGLFAQLPFVEAIEALRNRLSITKGLFNLLDESARSKSFTVARVADQRVLENIHDELAIAINNGETFVDFKKRIADLKERSGWTGTSPGHYRLIYQQNASMAYSAGRLQQGERTGLKVWRYLPSIAMHPRSAHASYYNKLYRAEPGHPMPPIDFNCACGWEWVFPDELEAMGKTPADFPTFNPPVPTSGFQWNVSAYLQANCTQYKDFIEELVMVASQRQEKKLTQGRQDAETAEIICDAVAVDDVPTRVMLVPWGDVTCRKGDFIVDEAGAELVLKNFREHGVDMVIDYEHQSLGGEFSSPSGKAPAAGWIRRLEISPGFGIYGEVDWTDEARGMIRAKEYRYLSPVAVLTKTDRRVTKFNSVGLTNTPAIDGVGALVNSDKGSALHGSGANSNSGADIMNVDELKTLVGQISEDAEMSDGDKLAKLIEAIGQLNAESESESGETVTEEVANSLKPIAAELGLSEGADVVTIINSIRTSKRGRAGMVPAEQFAGLNAKIVELEKRNDEREVDAIIQANANKIAPANEDYWRSFLAADRTKATELLGQAPVVIANSRIPSAPKGGPGANREAIIANARKAFTSESVEKMVICSEQVFVNGTLIEAGQKPLTEDETNKHAIVVG